MDQRYRWEVFYKQNRSYKIVWKIVPLNHYGGTIKLVWQYNSRVLFQALQVSFKLFNGFGFRIKTKFQLVKNLHFFEKVKGWELEKLLKRSIMHWLKPIRLVTSKPPFLYLPLLLYLSERIFFPLCIA